MASNNLCVGRPHSEYLNSHYYRSLREEQDKEIEAKREKTNELAKLKQLKPKAYDAIKSLQREIRVHQTKINELGDEAGQWIFERKCLNFNSFNYCPSLTLVLVEQKLLVYDICIYGLDSTYTLHVQDTYFGAYFLRYLRGAEAAKIIKRLFDEAKDKDISQLTLIVGESISSS
jgi:hypothetical protein